mmetsp:Transcript_19349/g.55475  ORF Transcript_19349/g.55475 Transcript_19349/m.55475 type:complete len:208 (-) Transcript_19349:697-1320(-)
MGVGADGSVVVGAGTGGAVVGGSGEGVGVGAGVGVSLADALSCFTCASRTESNAKSMTEKMPTATQFQMAIPANQSFKLTGWSGHCTQVGHEAKQRNEERNDRGYDLHADQALGYVHDIVLDVSALRLQDLLHLRSRLGLRHASAGVHGQSNRRDNLGECHGLRKTAAKPHRACRRQKHRCWIGLPLASGAASAASPPRYRNGTHKG